MRHLFLIVALASASTVAAQQNIPNTPQRIDERVMGQSTRSTESLPDGGAPVVEKATPVTPADNPVAAPPRPQMMPLAAPVFTMPSAPTSPGSVAPQQKQTVEATVSASPALPIVASPAVLVHQSITPLPTLNAVSFFTRHPSPMQVRYRIVEVGSARVVAEWASPSAREQQFVNLDAALFSDGKFKWQILNSNGVEIEQVFFSSADCAPRVVEENPSPSSRRSN